MSAEKPNPILSEDILEFIFFFQDNKHLAHIWLPSASTCHSALALHLVCDGKETSTLEDLVVFSPQEIRNNFKQLQQNFLLFKRQISVPAL